MDKYIIEVRDSEGKLDSEKEKELRKSHPEFFTKPHYNIDELTWKASYAGGRNKAMGPMELPEFMDSIGLSYRVKYW